MKKISAIIVLLLSLLVFLPDSAQALPKNFRNVDTFFVGAMPTEKDIAEFRALGITTIISLHELPPEVKQRAQKAGLKLYSFPLRTRLKHIDEIMQVMREAPMYSVYVHCLHGADRTGAVTAYWLYTERKYDPFAALASVISPSELHVKGLSQLAQEYGICLDRNDSIGQYSGAKNGGIEGLKICGNEWYTRLARNFLTMTIGEPINRQNEKFWNKYNKKQ